MFDLETAWWEIVLRVALIYVALLVLVRISGKRQLGQLAPMDLLAILLLAETVSPGLTGQDYSVAAGLIAAATLVGMTFLNGWATYRWRWFERNTEGEPETLIRNGALNQKVMRAENVTRQEIDTALRRHGIRSIDEVVLGSIEPDGELSFLVRRGSSGGSGPGSRRGIGRTRRGP